MSTGDDILLGLSVEIPSGPKARTFERLDTLIRNQAGEPRQVVVGKDCWIGAGSSVVSRLFAIGPAKIEAGQRNTGRLPTKISDKPNIL